MGEGWVQWWVKEIKRPCHWGGGALLQVGVIEYHPFTPYIIWTLWYIFFSILTKTTCVGSCQNLWRIQEFENRGARSRHGRILKSGVYFDAHSHILLVKVVNKIHLENIVCWLKSNYMRVLQSKLKKTNPKDFQNRGAHAWRAGPGSAFENNSRK